MITATVIGLPTKTGYLCSPGHVANNNSSIEAMASEVGSYLNGSPLSLYGGHETFDFTENDPKKLVSLTKAILRDALEAVNDLERILGF